MTVSLLQSDCWQLESPIDKRTGTTSMPKQNKQLRKTDDPPKQKRGRPEKFVKIDGTPENVARAL